MKTPHLINNSDAMERKDYPRPQWKRESWYCLNGKWNFAFDFGVSGEERGMVNGGEYPLEINVPFCPESKLSGIEYTDFIPAVWYKRTIYFDKIPRGRAILHFGAVDYESKIWVNGILCKTHKGGYSSFDADITNALKEGENTIVVFAKDDVRNGKQPFGKQSQKYHSHSCSYTRTTGIWQTVWLEFVPEKYMVRAQMTPRAKDGALDVIVYANDKCDGDILKLKAFYKGKEVGNTLCHFSGDTAHARLSVDEIHLWDVGKPEIYDLVLETVSKDGSVCDIVESYFALRDVALSKNALMINGKNVFMRLILDQGFHPDGVYTFPDDETIKRDIQLSMDLGFNGARLHQRVFEDRTLYYADMLGYIVWGECASASDMTHTSIMEIFLPEWLEVMKGYYNHPSIIGWCCFNETYHCFELDSEAIKTVYRITKMFDSSRPVIDASGGVHYETDMFDVHNYEQDPEKLFENLKPMIDNPKKFHSPVFGYLGNQERRPETYIGQPYWVSEYGGTYWNPKGEDGNGWGYGEGPKKEAEFAKRYASLTSVLLSHPRVCGFCYTQLTDIEQEQNGLYFYDRSRKFSDFVYDEIKNANTQKAKIEE